MCDREVMSFNEGENNSGTEEIYSTVEQNILTPEDKLFDTERNYHGFPDIDRAREINNPGIGENIFPSEELFLEEGDNFRKNKLNSFVLFLHNNS
jgi:hypothetical protein